MLNLASSVTPRGFQQAPQPAVPAPYPRPWHGDGHLPCWAPWGFCWNDLQFLKFFCTRALPYLPAVPLPSPAAALWVLLTALPCHGWRHWTALPSYWPVALLFQNPDQATDYCPLSLPIELIFSPKSCSFTQHMCLHLPKSTEHWGVQGIYKSQCITPCYSAVVYTQLFHMADSQTGPTCKSLLFLMIFWSLICMEIDSKRICSKMLLAPEVSLNGLWIPQISFLPFLKSEHNMNLLPVPCGLFITTGDRSPQGHQPGLSAVLNESSLDTWFWIPLRWSCCASGGRKPRVSCYEHTCIHTSFIFFFFFLVIQALIWKWFGLIYMLMLLAFRFRKASPSEIKFSHWCNLKLFQIF